MFHLQGLASASLCLVRSVCVSNQAPASSGGYNTLADQHWESLQKQLCDIKKGLKAASKLHDMASEVEDQSTRFSAAVDQLGEALQENQIHLDDLGYLIKFRKTKDGVALNVAMAKNVTKTSVTALQCMIESSKSLRALMPKRPIGDE